MKRVLIITYYWPPSGGAGVQRWLKFVKYLREFGWEPIVYTAENAEMPVIDASLEKDIPNNITVLKTKIWEPYSFYKTFIGKKQNEKINASFLSENKKPSITEKISVWIRGNFFIPDARKFWINPSVKYLNDYLKKNPVDAIISTGPPHSMHLIALGVKKNFPSIKWVADFRDPWTNIDFYKELMLSSSSDKKHKRLEKEVLKNADSIISIGNGMNEEFKTILGSNPEKFTVITNGFDEDDLYKGSIETDKKFSIAHIGTLVKSRNPETLWKVLKSLCEINSDFKNNLEIKLVGKVDYYVMERLKHYQLDSFIRKIDYLPHNEVIKEQQKSKVLLLLVNNTPNAKSILTGKIFEYLAANVPILAIGPTDGDLAAILKQTQSGLISDFNDENLLKENILKIFSGQNITPDKKAISQYSRKELTRTLSSLLEKLCNKN
ncbi:MAG: glycosyltransferase family 4 protein [Bacteroidetes bacterium]|nr:glycosyltransferase family 4 protein [Bacteroidota bacterium]